MQATIVMLMALTSLGCKHKSCEVAPVASCYSSCSSASYTTVLTGCYTNSSCYTSSSCYSGSSCYAETCYSSCQTSMHGHRKMGHGMFHKKCGCRTAPVASCCSSSPAVYGGYSSVSYEAPVYAAAQTPMVSAQSYSAPMTTTKMMPSAMAPAKGAPQSGYSSPAMVPVAPATSVPPPPAAATDVIAPAAEPAPAVEKIAPQK